MEEWMNVTHGLGEVASQETIAGGNPGVQGQGILCLRHTVWRRFWWSISNRGSSLENKRCKVGEVCAQPICEPSNGGGHCDKRVCAIKSFNLVPTMGKIWSEWATSTIPYRAEGYWVGVPTCSFGKRFHLFVQIVHYSSMTKRQNINSLRLWCLICIVWN